MSIAIIDINDIGLRCFHDATQVVSPGYALLTNDGVITGEPALRRSYLEPQQSFNQYWRQLSLSPLAVASRYARHHADLAYAQLLQLHAEAGEPREVIFAVPGSFTDDQLSILLGLGNALPFEVVGLVDAAVAASLNQQQGELVHVDVQLHQTVLTRIQADQQFARTAVELLPDLGLKACYDIWAHFIADQYIRQYRYDPLHTAAGEQQLHDKLPGWLRQLQHNTELPIELETTQGALRLNLSRAELLQASQRLQQSLANALGKLAETSARIIYSHRIEQLPGFGHEGQGVVLGEREVMTNCLANLDIICGEDDGVAFVTRLPAGKNNDDSRIQPTPDAARVSHVLVDGVAYRIGEKLVLGVGDEGLRPTSNTEGADLLVMKNGSGVVLQALHNNLETQANLDDLRPGDSITIGGFTLQLIEVT